jgi:hypothetical protein
VTTGASARPFPSRWIVWLLPMAVALHNLEEALTFARHLPAVAAGLPAGLRPWVDADTLPRLYGALVLATLVPLAICVWCALAPGNLVARRLVLAIWVVLLLNVAWHVGVALFMLHGYAPGLVTALAVNLPLSLAVLRRAMEERWWRPSGERVRRA